MACGKLKPISYAHSTGQADNSEHLSEVLPTPGGAAPTSNRANRYYRHPASINPQVDDSRATKPIIYILMKCMSCNGGRASSNGPFNSGCIRRSSGAALPGVWVDCQFISVKEEERNPVAPTSAVSSWQWSLCNIRTLRALLKTLHVNETDPAQHSQTLHSYSSIFINCTFSPKEC